MKRIDRQRFRWFVLCLVAILPLVNSTHVQANVTRIVTDPVGNQETWVFQENLGVHKLLSRTSLVDNKGITNQYDTNNNLISTIDAEGHVTTYTYNATNQRTSMTEAAGTAEARTTTYTYISADLDLVSSVSIPSVYAGLNKVTTTVYDADLNPAVISISGFDIDGNPVTRTTGYSYNTIGQVIQIDGPRTDVTDITDIMYYDCNTGAECGQIASVINAVGHTTTYDSYDQAGNLLQSTDANGNISTYSYDPRQRITSITITPVAGSARATLYTYDNVGQVIQLDLPDGIQITNTYNDARYLTSVEDNLGNRIEYAYDLKGNRIQSATMDNLGELQRIVDTAFDHRNYAIQFNNAGSITDITRDALGNESAQSNPNNNLSQYAFDSLNRLMQFIDPVSGQTSYTYDIQDQVTRLIAPNGVTTQYEYDDLGNLLIESSADRGLSTYSHDSAGNLLTILDARGITASFTYDPLNRPTSIDYPGTDEDVVIIYDSCLNGKGRLCQVTDQTGITDYTYDSYGNTTGISKHEMESSYHTSYRYDEGNRITEIAYPSQRIVTYMRDAIGRITHVTSTYHGITTDLVTNITYRVDGLIASKTYGNGLLEIMQYDQQGRLTNQVHGDTNIAYTYDTNGNLLGLDKDIEDRNYEYDSLDRLITDSKSDPADLVGDYAYQYDGNGNRTELTVGTEITTYNYKTGSNQLSSMNAKGITYDASGNVTSTKNGRHQYTYNQSGRLASYTRNGKLVSQYNYNAQGQRTRKIRQKTEKSVETYYRYDLHGNLISEIKNGRPYRDYLWLDNQPVAQIQYKQNSSKIKQTTYISTDHLNTPRIGTNESQQIVWRWDSEGFGSVAPTRYTIGDTSGPKINLRFPGQYYDSESGLYYNWNRYYDPRIGRYITSDPIGLDGGVNTYGYVSQNPLFWNDPLGLDAFTVHGGINIPFVGGLEIGIVEFFGNSVASRDIGVFVTIKKNDGGLALAKATLGISQTEACRNNFDGLDAEVSVGLLEVGGSIGGFSDSQFPNSLSIDVGPQAGFESSVTLTGSLTIGDLARAISRLVNGPGGEIFSDGCTCN